MKTDDVQRFEKSSRSLIDIILACGLRKAYVEEFLGKRLQKELDDVVANPHAMEAMNALRLILLMDFVQSLANATFDIDRRSVSIHNIMSKLERADYKRYYLSKRSDIDAGSTDSRPKNVGRHDTSLKDYEDKVERYRSLHDQIQTKWKTIKDDPAFADIKKIRNKVIAHFELNNTDPNAKLVELSDIGMNWRDSLRLFDAILDLSVDIYAFVLGSHYVLKNVLQLQRNWAQSISSCLVE